jgi:hypothetical protein
MSGWQVHVSQLSRGGWYWKVVGPQVGLRWRHREWGTTSTRWGAKRAARKAIQRTFWEPQTETYTIDSEDLR